MKKRCTKCGEEKPLSGFYKSKTGKYGVGSYCRVCNVAINREKRERYLRSPGVKVEEKECGQCGKVKPIVEFYSDPGARDKAASKCKECDREYQRARYKKNGRARPRDKKAEQEYHRKRVYGITPEQYAAMIERSGGLCEICGRVPSEVSGKGACVDHCHDSGAVRGILCHPCNVALGNFRDDPEVLRAAIGYLERAVLH